ncbi:cytochrome P450 [Bradyrhizobium brasilense]|uniref:Cytochrome P450 n=1 Tax=Bradyrhizobium brasilense TaxID=1419277 RepID=A0ABY8J6U3_9BRAD|nr:cytochrome P450 [Bradyrhizobium brasilense]WFU61265.1 cytochrome P450 [Bradyrhizobium brasilense]
MRSTRDLAFDLVSRYPWFWRLVSKWEWLRRQLNQLFINIITNSSKPRPYPLSLWGAKTPGTSDVYTSWTGLVDRSYTGRHLPPDSDKNFNCLPKVDDVRGLFVRGPNQLSCPKSTALFCFFAQWFTDSFLRTDPDDVRKNTSNHEIDLCQIYGLSSRDTALLRANKRGRLKSVIIRGEEFPPRLFEDDGKRVRPEFIELSYIDAKTGDFRRPLDDPFNTSDRKRMLFASGLERGNSTIFYSALNTIFLREHNRLCEKLAAANPGWNNDDDRLFETARNINITQLLKIIVEDYINHLSSAQLKFSLETGFAEKQPWYRTNRICAEFDLLYRWHALVPTEMEFGGKRFPDNLFRYNNCFLIESGLASVFDAATSQRAGKITLHNTAPFLIDAEVEAMKKSRAWRLRSYNEYRARFGLQKLTSFDELTDNPELLSELKSLYGHVDHVELLIGLLAESDPDNVLGKLMTLMVGVDAFSQALTNPLLADNVYNEDTFTKTGLKSIAETSSLADIVHRNNVAKDGRVAFGIEDPPGTYGLPLVGTLWGLLDFFFISGWLEFLRGRQRKYGKTVFKTNLFGPTIMALDHRAIAPLFASDDLVPDLPVAGFRFQLPPLALVGNVSPSIYEAGSEHDRPKALYLDLLKARSRTLRTSFDAVADEFFKRWSAQKTFSFRDEIENFVVALIFQWMLGQRPILTDVRELYSGIFTHTFMSVTRFIPGSAYSRALKIFEELLAFVQKTPEFPNIASRAIEFGITDKDALAKRLTFLFGMNSFLGTQSLLKSIVGEFAQRPELRQDLCKEMDDVLGSDLTLPDLQHLDKLQKLDSAIREILRLHPPVFFIPGRATRDRLLDSSSGTFRIRKGELVLGVLPLAQRDEAIFREPDEFIPSRFEGPAASKHLIWPRGLHDAIVYPNDRTCPGKDLALIIAKLFCVTLLRKASWHLKQPPTWNTRYFSLNVAAPEGDLAVEKFEYRE